MGYLKYCIYLFMLVYNQAQAQHAPIHSLHWTVAAELPKSEEHTPSLGFAGPVTGLLHNQLLIAGGANFPSKMPWLGGSKNTTILFFIRKEKYRFSI